jgi:CRISPR-associated protein Csm2
MCRNYQFKVNYFDGDNIKKDLFSDEAERVVKWIDEDNYIINSNGEYLCKGRYEKWDKNCPKNKRKTKKKTLHYSQIRKFYDEVLNLKAQLDNGKKFLEILPYFKMLKAKANVAYSRDVINTNFKTFIEKNVDYVDDDEKKFKVLCTFFEAVVAYSKGTFKE